MSEDPTTRFIKKSGSSLFGGAVTLRGAFYDHGLLPIHRIDGLVVVSVGNIRVGGSGKTPLVIYVATRLREKGLKTAVLMRGYKGNLEHKGGLVSSGSGPLVSPDDAGDEAYLISVRTKGVFVWAGADREAGARFLRDQGIEVVVLDDGFQRRSLYRDLDIVLVSPKDLDPGTELLPGGPLREPSNALKRAHLVGGFLDDWKGIDEKPDLLMTYRAAGLVRSGSDERMLLSKFDGASVYLMSGIARPKRFHATAEQSGLTVVGTSEFPDHHKFSAREIEEVVKRAKELNAEFLLTTEKDLPRIARFEMELPLLSLSIDVDISNGSQMLDDHLTRILSP